MKRMQYLLAVVLGACMLGGCATTPEAEANNDPFEPVNRVVFDVNHVVDKYVAVPVGEVYSSVTPKPVRTGVHNVLINLSLPVTFVNDILQGNPDRALQTFYRFGINSTLGLAGLFDIAKNVEGVQPHTEDLGQTLGVWGIGEGPYLVLPLIGPSNPRDFAGNFGDAYFDPFFYAEFEGRHAILVTRHTAGLVDGTVATIGNVKALETDPDPYVLMRANYRKRRQDQIENVPNSQAVPVLTPEVLIDDARKP
jgi:phospholipid-binding lipoprotein MlaA